MATYERARLTLREEYFVFGLQTCNGGSIRLLTTTQTGGTTIYDVNIGANNNTKSQITNGTEVRVYTSVKCGIVHKCSHSEKSPSRPMLFYSTNYWHQF